MKNFLLVIASLIQIGYLAPAAADVKSNQLPRDWYLSPEDQSPQKMGIHTIKEHEENKKFPKFLERVYNANLEAMDKLPERKNPPTSNNSQLPNHAPWHLEAFTTELAVYAKGLVGVLTMKGQPAVQVYWRRQGPKPEEILNQPPQTQADAVVTHEFDGDISDHALGKEMEPMIQSALATGKIKDESEFRKQILIAAQEFRFVSSGLDSAPQLKWFLGWFRFDFIVGASGKIYAAPLVTVGGDLRLRFDWHRHMRKVPTGARPQPLKPKGVHILAQDLDKFRKDLQDFTIGMQKDLEYALAKEPATKGMQAYAFKVSLGMSANGTIGVAKGNVGVFGHMNFINNTPVPKVFPVAPKVANLEVEEQDLPPLIVIEKYPSEQHLQFSDLNLIAYSLSKDKKEAHFKVDRKAFRKGLMRAVQMGQFFAKVGQSKDPRKWKVFQLKTGFDLSLSGILDLVTIGGTAGAEMAFFNMNF